MIRAAILAWLSRNAEWLLGALVGALMLAGVAYIIFAPEPKRSHEVDADALLKPSPSAWQLPSVRAPFRRADDPIHQGTQ